MPPFGRSAWHEVAPIDTLATSTRRVLARYRAAGALRPDGTVDARKLEAALAVRSRAKKRTRRRVKTWGLHRPAGLLAYPTKG